MRIEVALLAAVLLCNFIYIDGGPIEDGKSVRDSKETENGIANKQETGAIDTKPNVAEAGVEGEHATVPTTIKSDNCTDVNGTNCSENDTTVNSSIQAKLKDLYNKHRGMLMRSFYVLIGVTGIVIIYFIVRTVR